MNKNTPSLEQWRKLYDAAAQIKALAPWQWMTEDQIFGVEDPNTQEIGFVSVMGLLGEHLSIGVYRGVNALYRFWGLQELEDPQDVAQALMETSQFQASFEDREMVEKEDKEVIKQLGLKFRGRQAWPIFRNYTPGYVPWFLKTAEEVEFFTCILQQTVGVSTRLQTDPNLLEYEDEETFLVRVAHMENGVLHWRDEPREIVPSKSTPVHVQLEIELIDMVKRQGKPFKAVEVDCFMMLTPVYEGERPFYPYCLLVAEPRSGFILGVETLFANPTLEDMWGGIPQAVLVCLARAAILPKEIKVRSHLMEGLLGVLNKAFNSKIKRVRRLPAVAKAQSSLLAHIMGSEFEL